jgi:predicted dehydrogenase
VGGVVMKVGVIGFSEGNGHPFSFSAIVNGYDPMAFADAGWPVIDAYLRQQHAADFGFGDARITHAWTQDAALTARLSKACNIATASASVAELVEAVDAVIIARDDWQSHWELAAPALERGLPVFVDKPLTLDKAELGRFRPYLESGRLMSCSGLRYAPELDALRAGTLQPELGEVRLISATVLNDLAKYGIHMIEAVVGLGLIEVAPVRLERLAGPFESVRFIPETGPVLEVNCLGAVGRTFRLSVFGTKGHAHFDLHSNFASFRRCLFEFFAMVRSGKPSIPPEETLRIIDWIRTARELTPGETAIV